MTMDTRSYVFGLAILATSLVTNSTCMPLRSAAARVPFRPPSWVFGVVWPVLYVTTGVAWRRAGYRFDSSFLPITALCCLWLVLYSCLRAQRVAAAVLVLSAILSWWLCLKLKYTARIFLIPLAVWLTYASYLNIASLPLIC